MKFYLFILSLITILPYICIGQDFMPKLSEYYGATYDIFSGNPLSKDVDPGFRPKQLFEFTYDENLKTEVGSLYFPKEINLRLVESCARSFRSTEIKGLKSYHDTLNVAVSVSGGYDDGINSVSFTASSDYKRAESELSTENKVRILTQEKCELYSVGLKTRLKLSQDFLDAVEAAISLGSWEDFIRDWGTHYASQLKLGASMIRETSYDRETVQKMKSIGINVAAAVSASYGAVYGGISVSTGLTSEQQSYYDSAAKVINEYSIGTPLPSNADNSTWALEIEKTEPLPLSFSLKYIGDLFNSKGYRYFGDKYDEAQLNQMRADFNSTVHDFASRSTSKVPASDPPVVPLHILTSSTVYVGGTGGNYFEDPEIQDIFMKPQTIEIRSGNTLDGIRLTMSNGVTNQPTEWHGGGGGNYQTFDIPEGKRIDSAQVWVGGLVNGIRFFRDDGIYSPIYGNQNGAQHTIKIYGYLTGFRGRSGNRVDSIGFISNALSDPTYSTTVTVATPLYGGGGGNLFVDQLPLTGNNPHAYVRSGSRLDSIRLTVDGNEGAYHGGDGGDPNNLSLNGLQTIRIRAGNSVDAVQFQVNGEWTNLFGGSGGDLNSWTVPSNQTLIGVYGRSGNRIDAIGFIFAKTG